jgi:AraC family transcriptional regulator
VRVLDVAVACGFKTQQHFAQVFSDVSGVSPTHYRRDFLDSETISVLEPHSEETLSV